MQKKKLKELSVKYNEKHKQVENLTKEKQSLEEKLEILKVENQNLQCLQREFSTRIKKIATFDSIKRKAELLAAELDHLLNLIISYSGEGFEEEELAELKGILRQLRYLHEKLDATVEQIRPYTVYIKSALQNR